MVFRVDINAQLQGRELQLESVCRESGTPYQGQPTANQGQQGQPMSTKINQSQPTASQGQAVSGQDQVTHSAGHPGQSQVSRSQESSKPDESRPGKSTSEAIVHEAKPKQGQASSGGKEVVGSDPGKECGPSSTTKKKMVPEPGLAKEGAVEAVSNSVQSRSTGASSVEAAGQQPPGDDAVLQLLQYDILREN